MKGIEAANGKNAGIWVKTRVGDKNFNYGLKSLGCARKKSICDTSVLWSHSVKTVDEISRIATQTFTQQQAIHTNISAISLPYHL